MYDAGYAKHPDNMPIREQRLHKYNVKPGLYRRKMKTYSAMKNDVAEIKYLLSQAMSAEGFRKIPQDVKSWTELKKSLKKQ